MIVRYVGTPALGAGFLEYLAARLRVRELHFAEAPVQIDDGLETFIYRFRLDSRDGLAAAFRRPLIARIYSSPLGLPRVRHEVAAQRFLRMRDYPVARPLLVEEDSDLLGGPFALVECLPGRTLLDVFTSQPWRLVNGPAQFAEQQARLHQLPPDGFPTPRGPFLSRRLEELTDWIDAYELDGLRPGLDWLVRNRPADPERPSVLHLDFHPINILFDGGQCSGVIDWCDSDVGDRHADVATTLVLMKTAPVEIPHAWERPFCGLARWIVRERYRHVYDRLLPLERDKLSYYAALASLRRLTRWGLWLRATPRVTGSKPSAMHYLTPERVAGVADCFREETGTEITL